jgi:hypothetical protein
MAVRMRLLPQERLSLQPRSQARDAHRLELSELVAPSCRATLVVDRQKAVVASTLWTNICS